MLDPKQLQDSQQYIKKLEEALALADQAIMYKNNSDIAKSYIKQYKQVKVELMNFYLSAKQSK